MNLGMKVVAPIRVGHMSLARRTGRTRSGSRFALRQESWRLAICARPDQPQRYRPGFDWPSQAALQIAKTAEGATQEEARPDEEVRKWTMEHLNLTASCASFHVARTGKGRCYSCCTAGPSPGSPGNW